MSSATMTVKEKMLNFLGKTEGKNTFSVAQGRRLFGVTNVSAHISILRKEGHQIYTNVARDANGEKVAVYRLGTPTKSTRKNALYARLRTTAV